MDPIQVSEELIRYIQESPSMFHTVHATARRLSAQGFTCLKEEEPWSLQLGGKYYATRNDSSLIAFRIGENLDNYHFQLTAAHSDSPTFKVKSNHASEKQGGYVALNCEAYGGMIDSTWLDRPLGVAGRIMVEGEDGIKSHLVNIDEDVLLIPNAAIHLNRELNKGYSYNRQTDLEPIFSAGAVSAADFDRMVAEAAGVDPGKVMAQDLFLVNRQRPCVWGYGKEFVSSPKLDDLQCAYASLQAFISSSNPHAVSVYCLFDNEEVGSNTKQGALSTFLKDTLGRINANLGKTAEELAQAQARSFMVSCDNAHALHPHKAELYDGENACFLNQGPVVKEAANQSYTTDALSRSVFKMICRDAGVPCQTFANRSDRAGGSTLGNLSNMQVSMHAVDMGLPQLAMHSSYETAGVKDTLWAIQALRQFFNSDLEISGASRIAIRNQP